MVVFGTGDGRKWQARSLTAAALVTFATSCGRTDNQPQPAAQAGAGAEAGMTGIVLSEAPPFSIPAAPTPAALVPCDASSWPEPRGFLPDGRAVVVQRLSALNPVGDLVRAWDVTTNELETLVTTQPFASIGLSDDGSKIFERFTLTPGGEPAFRVHAIQDGAVSSSQPIAVALAAASGDGRFVLDAYLRRFTIAGKPDLDFAASLPEASRHPVDHVAMSYSGDAIATHGRSADTLEPVLFVVVQDGSVRELSEPPALDGCCNHADPLACGSYCGASFSRDGRYLLSVRSGGQLRVWDLSTDALIVRLDEPSLRSASFAPGTNRLLIATELDVTELDVESTEQFPWRLDGRHPFALGPNAVLGVEADALVVASREQILGRWRQPRPTWEASAVAVTDNASFAFAADGELSDGFWMMVARYVPDRAGPTATLRAEESQSEWNGQILLSPDEQRVAVVFPDSIRILDAATLEPFVSLPTGAGAIAWSPDGAYLVATPDLHYRDPGRPAYIPTKTLTVWNSSSGKLEATFATPTYAFGVAFSADGSKLVGSGYELKAVMGDSGADPGEKTFTVFAPQGDSISFSVDVLTGEASPNHFGELIGWTRELVATKQGVFRVSTSEQVSAIAASAAQLLPERVVFSSNAAVALAAFEDSFAPAKLFAVLGGQELASAPFAGPRIGLALSRDGRRVAAGTSIYCASPP